MIRFPGYAVPYSYMIDSNRQFQINPVTAPVVEDIFVRYANGEEIRSIINDLHLTGFSKNGKPFTYHFIKGMLKNRRYIGEYSFKDIVNTETIPPIVTVELFERCQQRTEANKHKPCELQGG